jgi:uncharacterized protein (TIGR02246 family)
VRQEGTAKTVAKSYFAAESRRDLGEVLDHFAEECVLVHPDGSRSVGHDAIRAFYAGIFEALTRIDVRPVDVIGDSERAAVTWRADVVDTGGAERTLRGVNLVTVRDGRFTRVELFFMESTSDA